MEIAEAPPHWDPASDVPVTTFRVHWYRRCEVLIGGGFAAGLEGTDFFKGAFEWPGSPLNIDENDLTGSLAFTGGKGRIVKRMLPLVP